MFVAWRLVNETVWKGFPFPHSYAAEASGFVLTAGAVERSRRIWRPNAANASDAFGRAFQAEGSL
jgi:hypothetical protein